MFKIYKGQWRGPGGKTHKSAYVQVDTRFRDMLHEFKGAPLSVLLAIMLHMDEDGQSYPSYDTLQRETGYGRDTISKAIDKLTTKRIDGETVLIKWRERNDDGTYSGSNHYVVFPTQEQIDQSGIIPTMDKSNSGKPDSKKNHTKEAPELKTVKPAALPQDDSKTTDASASQSDLYGVVMAHSFGIPIGESVPKAVAGFIGKTVKAVRQIDGLTVKELEAFYAQWDNAISPPRDGAKLAAHIIEWRSGNAVVEETEIAI